MDPLACFKRFCEAINDYDFDEMMSAIDDLRTWCRKGGFLPEEIPITFEGWKNLWTMFQKVGVRQNRPFAMDDGFYFVELDPETDKPLKGSTGYAVQKDGELIADGFNGVLGAAMFAGVANALGPEEAEKRVRQARVDFNYPPV